MPRDKQPPGEAQEKSVRARLTNQGYEEPYGSTDAQIKKRLGIKGRCADFVGYHPKEGKWLICESKGGDMDTAYEQLKNTMNGLLAKEPASNGKTDLRIYTSPHNYQKLTQDVRGLGGNRLRGGFLGYFDELRTWHYAEIQGVRIEVMQEHAQ